MASLLGIAPTPKMPAPPGTLSIEPERLWVTPEIAKTFRPRKLIFDVVNQRYLFISPKFDGVHAIDLNGTVITTLVADGNLKNPVDLAIPYFDQTMVLILLESGLLFKYDGLGLNIFAFGRFNGISSDQVLTLTSSFGTQVNTYDLREIPPSVASETAKWTTGRSWLCSGGYSQPKISFTNASSSMWGAKGSSNATDNSNASCIPNTPTTKGNTKPSPTQGAFIRMGGSILSLKDSKATTAKELFRLRQRYVAFLGDAPPLCLTPEGDLLCGSLLIPRLYLQSNYSPHHEKHKNYAGPDLFPSLLDRLCEISSSKPVWPQISCYEFDARKGDTISKIVIPKSVFGFLFPNISSPTFNQLKDLFMHPEAWTLYFRLILSSIEYNAIRDIAPVIDMVRIASFLKVQSDGAEAVLRYIIAEFSAAALANLLHDIRFLERPARDNISRIIIHSFLASSVPPEDPVWQRVMDIEQLDADYFFQILHHCGKARQNPDSLKDARKRMVPVVQDLKPTLMNRLQSLRSASSGYAADYTLICCGEKIHVHSWVLYTSWEYFRTYLASGAAELNQMDLRYHLTPAAMNTLLEYWYSGGSFTTPSYRHSSLLLHEAKFFGFCTSGGIVANGFQKLFVVLWDFVRHDGISAGDDIFAVVETAVDSEDYYELKLVYDILRNNLLLANAESSKKLKKSFPDAYAQIMKALVSGSAWM